VEGGGKGKWEEGKKEYIKSYSISPLPYFVIICTFSLGLQKKKRSKRRDTPGVDV